MDPLQAFWLYEPSPGHVPADLRFCRRCGAEYGGFDLQSSGFACGACGQVHYRNPLPAVSVLVVDGDQVLLVRRRSSAFEGGRWCLPAGYIDHGEDFLTAARREVLEESGAVVEIQSIISVVSNFFTRDRHSLVVALLARMTGGELVPGDDADAVGWFAPDVLPALAFEGDDHLIHRYFATRLAGAPVDPRLSRG